MKKIVLSVIVSILLAGPVSAMGADICSAPVATAQGQVLGMSEPDMAACAWKGIPYAAPPIGQLRWKAPQPAALHDMALEAFEFGPACMQNESFFSGGKSPAGVSEDCLTLNIWSPKKSGSFPVMYWIHGGGLTIGASSYEMYDGARLAAERDVVLVSVNYRLNVFGFLASKEAASEDPNGSTGNYGLMDQIAGLDWVKDNIAAFGGDPDNVTIFGESAGGVSVCDLYASPPAEGLFDRAIIESGGCDLTIELDKGYKETAKLADKADCEGDNTIECLRALPADKLLTMGDGFGTSFVDGYVIPEVPVEMMRKGDTGKVPLMVGNNREETSLFLAPAGVFTMPGFVVKALVKKMLGDRYETVNAMYPRAEFGRPAKRTIAFTSEAFGSRGFQAAEAACDSAPVYYYSFDWDDYFGGKTMGAFHGLEIPFVFGNTRLKRDSMKIVFRSKKIDKRARPLSEQMMSYWTNFAKTGDPNGQGLPEWPTYSTDKRERIHFDSIITVSEIPADQLKRYQYWEKQKISAGDLKPE